MLSLFLNCFLLLFRLNCFFAFITVPANYAFIYLDQVGELENPVLLTSMDLNILKLTNDLCKIIKYIIFSLIMTLKIRIAPKKNV